jgi:hypothetical protein
MKNLYEIELDGYTLRGYCVLFNVDERQYFSARTDFSLHFPCDVILPLLVHFAPYDVSTPVPNHDLFRIGVVRHIDIDSKGLRIEAELNPAYEDIIERLCNVVRQLPHGWSLTTSTYPERFVSSASGEVLQYLIAEVVLEPVPEKQAKSA